MTAARSLGIGARRSGITLTEILIAILIMGVGLISLATLFPLGLLRLREGTRQGRSGTTFVSAANELNTRALLYKPSFRTTWYGLRDPFVQDALADGSYNLGNVPGQGVLAANNFQIPTNNIDYGNVAGSTTNVNPLTTGLPICYDPLWRDLTGVVPNTGLFDPTLDFQGSYAVKADEARFGSGIFGGTTPYIPADTNNGIASAYGLQRLTNFIPWSSKFLTSQYSFTCNNFALTAGNQPADVAGNVFTSVDDLVYNPTDGTVKTYNSSGVITGTASSLLPDMSTGGPQADYRFSWFFTGRQVDANGNGAQFTGELVVCDSRPFGFDSLPNGLGSAPSGETVVEAVFGVGKGSSIVPIFKGATSGFAVNDRTVLLRWKNALADPAVRVGGWICDVTYERSTSVYRSRIATTGSTFARCNWYQVVKRVDPQVEVDDTGTPTGNRTMVVTINSPVRTKTLLNTDGTPVHRNVALVMPSVINVFPRSFEVH